MTLRVLGVDPGPTTGICLLRYPNGKPSVYQCDAASALPLIAWLIASCANPVTCAGEAFQAGRGPGARTGEANITRNLIAGLDDMHGVNWRWRAAGLVKPWATDARLARAGLMAFTRGMPQHARDAARHALYSAVLDCGMRDPVSRKPGP